MKLRELYRACGSCGGVLEVIDALDRPSRLACQRCGREYGLEPGMFTPPPRGVLGFPLWAVAGSFQGGPRPAA